MVLNIRNNRMCRPRKAANFCSIQGMRGKIRRGSMSGDPRDRETAGASDAWDMLGSKKVESSEKWLIKATCFGGEFLPFSQLRWILIWMILFRYHLDYDYIYIYLVWPADFLISFCDEIDWCGTSPRISPDTFPQLPWLRAGSHALLQCGKWPLGLAGPCWGSWGFFTSPARMTGPPLGKISHHLNGWYRGSLNNS